MKSSLQLFLCVEGLPCLQEWPKPESSGYHVLVEPVRDRGQHLGMLGKLGLFSGWSSWCYQPLPTAAHTKGGAQSCVGSTHRQRCCTWLRPVAGAHPDSQCDKSGQPQGHSRLLAAGWAGPQFSCLSLQFCEQSLA